ncbi:VOC family protein [soil metagenome]
MGNRVVHFEIHCPNLAAAKKFYSDVFDWQLSSCPGPQEYVLAKTGEPSERGIDGGMMPSKGGQPLVVNTLQVDNVDDAVKKVLANGGTMALEKMPIPGIGWLAYCKDPGGNIFGMMHPDPNAK